MERAVQYVRGNFFAGESFADLADAQRRVEVWCAHHGRAAGARHHRATPGRTLRRRRSSPCCCRRRRPPYDVPVFATPKVAPGPARGGRAGVLLGAGRTDRAAGARPRRHAAGEDLLPRAADQDPSAQATRWALHRPGGPTRRARSDYALRDVAVLEDQGRRGGVLGRGLRRPAAGRAAAVDQHARRVPAARPDPQLRPGRRRRRLRPRPRTRRRRRPQDRPHARAGPEQRPGTRRRRRWSAGRPASPATPANTGQAGHEPHRTAAPAPPPMRRRGPAQADAHPEARPDAGHPARAAGAGQSRSPCPTPTSSPSSSPTRSTAATAPAPTCAPAPPNSTRPCGWRRSPATARSATTANCGTSCAPCGSSTTPAAR